ncbi:MAG: uracil-DNA glycosylase [Candidatus Eisenbacteria bacterium]
MSDKEMKLLNLSESLEGCQRCGLWEGRTNIVFGSGSPDAQLVFVGEAPGYHEDLQAEPFVGSAGKFLDELLTEILGVRRDDVYIANVLKCRPPENRDPTALEVDTCKPFVMQQLGILKPDTVCSLGNFATRTLTGKREGITKLRRKPVKVGDLYVFPMFHPAAALHRGDLYEEVRQDFRSLKEFLDSPRTVEEESTQRELF